VLEPNEARVRTQRPRPHLDLLQARPRLCSPAAFPCRDSRPGYLYLPFPAPPFYKLIWSGVYFRFYFSFLQPLYVNVNLARQFPAVITSGPSRTVRSSGSYTTTARKHDSAIQFVCTKLRARTKKRTLIHYIFAHGVVQPLLRCGREEQEQEGAKITRRISRRAERLDHHGQRL
jgi:hypothetical protein